MRSLRGKRNFISLPALALALLLLAGAALSACTPSLERAEQARREAEKATELDLSVLYNEEDGYHFSGIRWGMDSETILKSYTAYTMDSVAAYAEDGGILYKADGIAAAISGRKNDSATITVNGAGDICAVSLAYSSDSKIRKEGDLSEQELFEFFYEKLKERFGEADESTETKRTVNDVPTTYSNHYWNYTTPDGKKTQLQWAAAYISGEKEPTYVALGTVWLDPPAKES